MEARLLLTAHDLHDTHDLHGIPPFEFGDATAETAELAAAEVAAAFSAELPSATPPILHSLPGAEAKVFLDFDGNIEPSWGGNVNVLTPPFDVDGDPTLFSIDEQQRIYQTWARVSEDFAPFNVDVTTEDPADANTMLRQVISFSQRTRTFYFRHKFNVDDASVVSDLTLQLLRDDGAAVYLNGVEVVRDNLAPDAMFDDFASSTASGNEESTLQRFTLDASSLVDGENVLAVEVHQASDTSSDVSFDLSLMGTIAESPDVALVPLGAMWSYLDDGSDQGVLWQASDFDDSAWPMDQAEFGYGDSDEITALLVRPAGQGQTRTFYFRQEFDVADPLELEELTVRLLRDDGAAVYLNGEEVVRDNLAANAQFDDFASSTASNAEETTFYETVIATDLLREGRNVLAVEVHQVSDTSSDVSFDLELLGAGAAGDQSLVPAGSDWRYLDDGTDQGTAWREFEHDDISWPIGTSQFGYGDAPGTVHVAIGTEDWFEDGAGGVAFVNSFDLDDRTVVYTFTNGAGRSAKNMAEVSSHEAGHAFGLRHQSVYDPDTGERIQEYNPGEGDWAPIMGNSYSPALTTWHDGPVGSQGTPQDDMSLLARNANGFGYRTDDHGNRSGSASPLLLDSATRIDVSGIIERNSDQDVFAFTLAEGQGGISIAAAGAEFGANLDAVLEIQNQDGEVVATDDRTTTYNANIDTELDPGEYTVVVRSNGDYGRVGQYTLTGEVDEPLMLVELATVGPISPSAGASSELNAVINFTSDRDSFSVAAQAGEFISAVVTPTEQLATLTLSGMGLSEPIRGARGSSVVLPLTAIPEDGMFQLDVTGSRPTAYTIEFGVNLEFETTDSSEESMLALSYPTDASFDRLTVLGQSEKDVETVNLVGRNALWSYLDDGVDPGEQWQANDFDDGEWETGRGEFGYGDNDERTEVDEDGMDGTRNRTFYFRQQFEVADLASLDELSLELKFDDGVAVYLNGQEVVRDNLGANAGHNDFAPGTVSNEGEYRDYLLDATLLQEGSNVLAVEVHQASNTSSDVSMDARLTLTQQRAAVDAYTFDVSAAEANQPQRILLQGRDANFRHEIVEILTADGTVLGATERDDSTTYDLGLNWTAPSEGTYVARVTSSTVGRYVLSVGSDLSITKPGDTNFDGEVDFADFLVLSGTFGLEGGWSAGDFDGDGLVGFSDFLVLSSNFGK